MDPKKPATPDSQPWTIRRVLAWTREEFVRRQLDSPRLDAELLLGHALNLTRMQLYLDLDRPLAAAELAGFKALVKRRAAREPVSQIVGTREFFSRPFKVTRDTLTPRPETEHIIEDVMERLKKAAPPSVAMVDVGTGTGCIAITLRLQWKDSVVTALDISKEALQVARGNAASLQADVTFLESDMDAALPADAQFHVVVSNPPYLTEGEFKAADPEVREWEPRMALVGDDADGLGHHRRLARLFWPRVLPGGGLWAELGAGQGAAAKALWTEVAGDAGDVVILKDLAGLDRIARVTRKA